MRTFFSILSWLFNESQSMTLHKEKNFT